MIVSQLFGAICRAVQLLFFLSVMSRHVVHGNISDVMCSTVPTAFCQLQTADSASLCLCPCLSLCRFPSLFVFPFPSVSLSASLSLYLSVLLSLKPPHQWLDNPRYVKHASAVADLFCDRFAPLDMEDSAGDSDGGGRHNGIMSQAEAEGRAQEIRAAISRDVEHDEVQVSTHVQVYWRSLRLTVTQKTM